MPRKRFFAELEPKILNEEQKQRLIQQHLKQQQVIKRAHPLLIGSGVAICMVVLALGWYMTYGKGIWLKSEAPPDTSVVKVRETAKEIKQEIHQLQESIK